MEEPIKKACNDHEKNKVTVKIGAGAGGVGAVILLGGALATAALASAFVVGKKGLSSGRLRRSPSPEVNKQIEEDDSSKVSVDTPLASSEAIKEIESGNCTGLFVSTRSLTLDETSINDTETAEQILSSISPKKPENNAISDGSVIFDASSDPTNEKPPFELLKNIVHEEKVPLSKQGLSDEISKQGDNCEQVCDGEERAEKECRGDGETEGLNPKEAPGTNEMKSIDEGDNKRCFDQEDSEVELNAAEGENFDKTEGKTSENTKVNEEEKEWEGEVDVDVDVDQMEVKENSNVKEDKEEKEFETGVDVDQIEAKNDVNEHVNNEEKEIGRCLSESGEINEEKYDEAIEKTIVCESHTEDGQKTLDSTFESGVIGEENVNVDAKESVVPDDIVEVIQKDEASEEGEEDKVEYIEEQLVKENEKLDKNSEEIINPELQIEVEREEIPSENKDENGENAQFGGPVLRDGLVSSEGSEVKEKEEAKNEEVAENMEICKNKTLVETLVCEPEHNENGVGKNIANEVADEVKEEDGGNRDFAENLGTNENKTSVETFVSQPREEVWEDLISPEDIEVKEDGENTDVSENLGTNENKTPMDMETDLEKDITKEVEQELISPENIRAEADDGENEKVAQMEISVDQPEDDENDVETNTAKEAEEMLISREEIEIEEDGGEKEKVPGNTSSSHFDIHQPEECEDEFKREITEEVHDSSETSETGTTTSEDDLIVEMSDDETDSSEEAEDSSTDSSTEAVWPAESLKLIDQEMRGKIQEDKALKGNSEKTFGAELVKMKDHSRNSTRWKVIIMTLSVLSSLSCSWFFGVSSIKLCLIVFLAAVLSKIQGY